MSTSTTSPQEHIMNTLTTLDARNAPTVARALEDLLLSRNGFGEVVFPGIRAGIETNGIWYVRLDRQCPTVAADMDEVVEMVVDYSLGNIG